MVPPEPSLGVAIDEMEVTGTPSEVAASLNDPVSSMVRIDEATESVSANSKPDDDLAGPLGVHPAPAGVTPVSPVRRGLATMRSYRSIRSCCRPHYLPMRVIAVARPFLRGRLIGWASC